MGAPTWPPYPPTLGASRGTRDAPRPYALAERGFGGGLAGAYAVGDADATIGGAGEVQPRQRGGAALERLDARQMTDAVLWHRRRPARRAHQHRLGADAERLPQLAAGVRDEARVVLAQDGGHALAEHDRAVRQPVGERGDERLHAVGERDEEAEARAARPGFSRLREPATQAEDHRAVAALELDEARQRRRHAELLGIGGIDARDQRLSDALERLGAEPAAHEGTEALVVAAVQRAAAARQHQVERHARLAAPGEERRRRERRQARRREQLKAVGQRMQPSAEPDEDLAETVLRAHQLCLDAEPATERERPGLLGEKRVGPALDQEAVGALGDDGAAEAAARLDDAQVEVHAALARQLDRAVGRGQRGHAATDHDEFHAASRTKSASI